MTVPCKFCSQPTEMDGTRMCDECWELHRRLETVKPDVLLRIFEDLGIEVEP